MSLDYIEWHKIKDIEFEQKQQIELLRQMSEKQDRQIALLKKIISILENGQDDGR